MFPGRLEQLQSLRELQTYSRRNIGSGAVNLLHSFRKEARVPGSDACTREEQPSFVGPRAPRLVSIE
jgi:hypothetical protein